jgi:hypothetical protein
MEKTCSEVSFYVHLELVRMVWHPQSSDVRTNSEQESQQDRHGAHRISLCAKIKLVGPTHTKNIQRDTLQRATF